jgi:Ca-activated chloride channel family protein
MNTIESKFEALFEETLPPEERQNLLGQIAKDPILMKSYNQYRSIRESEKKLGALTYTVSENFTARVMDAVSQKHPSLFERLSKLLNNRRWIAASALGSCAILAVGLKLTLQLSDDTLTWKAHQPTSVVKDSAVVHESLISPVQPQTSARVDANGPGNKNALLIAPASRNETRRVGEPAAVEGIVNSENALEVPELKQEKADGRGGAALAGAMAAPVERNREGDSAPDVLYEDLVMSLGRAQDLGKPVEQERTATILRQVIPNSPPNAAAALIAPHSQSSGERYNGVEENRPQDARTNPVSTFSIDVDTGSYTNIRRFLMQRQLPPKEAVRIEEMLNYFPYDYPKQSSEPFSTQYEIAPSPLESGKHLLKLGIKARDIQNSERPWNLIFLLDVSGSMMTPNKLPLVKEAMKLLTTKMRPQDRISIVTYAGWTGVALPPTGASDRNEILRMIDLLQGGGGTNGAGGIQKAYELARSSFIEGGVNRVILATDGDFNVGVTNQQELLSMIERERQSGVSLTTIGVGEGNINEGLMEQLANKGNGNYFYLDSFREAQKVFEDDLAGTIETVAKDVKLQVEFNPNVVKSYRLIGYENRRVANEDFHNDAVDAGEIGAGHTVTALYEVVLATASTGQSLRYQDTAPQQGAAPGEIGFLQIRYKEPEGTESKLISAPLLRSTVRNSASESSADFRFAAAVSYAGHLLRQSQYAGSYTYQQVLELAASGLGSDRGGHRKEFIELLRTLVSNYPQLNQRAPGVP